MGLSTLEGDWKPGRPTSGRGGVGWWRVGWWWRARVVAGSGVAGSGSGRQFEGVEGKRRRHGAADERPAAQTPGSLPGARRHDRLRLLAAE